MPIYEYKCQKCGARFEQLLKRADEKVSCPECGSFELEKLFSYLGGVRGGDSSGSSSSSCPTGTCPFTPH
ncbi:hypothetical protein CH330_06280 [candidate division WOR-3 bacterium JGI_Cruoil_03_51_56]|uniref:Putative regulatory protein FmdB zinc ribbon domain-containing protein n=1 Tax=candidate division WOR-3 bacterium JGI_Cruoil_03_51_56 TaxID=1973747 RepID=A0A235BTY3_UNCW3|nr:MAG: hypothetical protein CH330_06280 [candidate division WOR-3 bacterium JGI_Cruoil_03_51_56]